METLGLTGAVTFVGYAGARELRDLYAHAACLVLPSPGEGFGLPVLAALARRGRWLLLLGVLLLGVFLVVLVLIVGPSELRQRAFGVGDPTDLTARERLLMWQSGERALVAGSIAAIAGFLVAGLFEYNFGDSEVAMLAYAVMALAFAASRASTGSWGGLDGAGPVTY